MNLNKNPITFSTEHMVQQQQKNHCKGYEVSKKRRREKVKEMIINIKKKQLN